MVVIIDRDANQHSIADIILYHDFDNHVHAD
jgi:hypothetical protein